MATQLVGHVSGLWRYPVKSMLGERLTRLEVDDRGGVGDRGYALWDPDTRRVASAKNPRRWAALLAYSARYLQEPCRGQPLPPVEVRGPLAGDGAPPTSLCSDDPDLVARLTQRLGRSVLLLDEPPAQASLDQFWPDVEGSAQRDVTLPMALPPGRFQDSCPLHAISTATLERLRQLEPALDFAVERFRPNLLIEPTGGPATGPGGFVEEGWQGGTLAIGEQLLLRVEDGCSRCVITTLAQGGLPESLEILRATGRHNRFTAGIRLSVLRPGPMALGDPLLWTPAGEGAA